MKELISKIWKIIASACGAGLEFLTGHAIGQICLELLGSFTDDAFENAVKKVKINITISETARRFANGKYTQGIDKNLLTERFFILSACVMREAIKNTDDVEEFDAPLGSSVGKFSMEEKKELVKLFVDYFSADEMIKAITEKSKIYEKHMNESEKNAFVKMLLIARAEFLEDGLRRIGPDDSKMVVAILKDAIEKSDSDLAKRLKDNDQKLVHISDAIDSLLVLIGQSSLDNGGSIRFDELRAMQYSPKFMARRCPECGYCGQRLIYFEKQEMFHCCACGLDYSLIKGIEQDELLMRGLEKIDKSTSLISASINELKASSYKQLADVKDKLAKCCNGIEDAGYTAERIEDSVNILSSDVDQIAERIDSLATEVLKKEYFEKMMKDTSGNMTAVIAEIAKGIKETVAGQADATYKSLSREIEGAQGSVENRISSLERAISKEGERLDNSIDEIKEQLKKLDVINENVLRVLDGVTRAQEQNDALREDMWRCFDGIKGFVSEYMSEMERQATRLSEGTPHTLSDGGATALSQADIEKIVAKSIDILTKAQALGAHATNASFDGATASLVYEISQIHTASCGSVNIPDSLKLIEADGDKATCPYCGVEDAHGRVNSDASYYKCKICGNQFLNVKKFRITERECADKELRALALDLRKSIEAWKEAHTVYLVPFNENGKYANNTPNNFLVFDDNIDSEIIVVNLDKRMRRLDGDKMELDDNRICKINEIIDYQHSFARAKRIIFYSREGRDVTISGEFLTGSISSHVKYKCYTHKGKIN